jgi:diguanylate cyclase (GGDEF)-like protein
MSQFGRVQGVQTSWPARLYRLFPQVLALAFLLLWLLGALVIWRNWLTSSEYVRVELQKEMTVALRSKATEIEGVLQRTYRTIRTISLLPGVRAVTPHNRSNEDEDVVSEGRISQADYDTVQQLYNHVASSVSVSEIYLVFDGFDPQQGQTPFLMFDQVIVDRFQAQLAAAPAGSSPDHPEEYEADEYLDYVRQLAQLRQRPATGLADLSSILPISSAEMRTCDNSQYPSLAAGDPRNTLGFSLSVPIFGRPNGQFTGLVTAVLRSNVLEAALIGWPLVPTNEAEWALLPRDGGDPHNATAVNYLLENTLTGLRISDRRNAFWSAPEAEREATAFQASLPFTQPGTSDWKLHSYVAQAALAQALAPLRAYAYRQLAVLSVVLALLGFCLAKVMQIQHRSTQQLQEMAHTDTLTGLPNRRFLLDRLEYALKLSGRSRQMGALLFIDLDNFKALNDTRGHEMGDLLLQQVARRLRQTVRDSDTVARLGGDEFVIMLEQIAVEPASAAAKVEAFVEKLQGVLNQPYNLSGTFYDCTPSMGVAMFTNGDVSAMTLMMHADLAMYQAKTAGRNAVRFFAPQMLETLQARAKLESELRAGLQNNEFVLHYQPQVDVQGRVTGAEVLVRWQHPERGLVSPLEFIPVCEACGLIVELGGKILEAACYQLAAWASRPELESLTLAVNISAPQFAHPAVVEMVLATLKATGVNPARLKLELTESMLVHDVDAIINTMDALRAEGIRFSLDDFGTGFSSLAYLKRLPLHQLKIDGSFVRDIGQSGESAAIVRTIIALGSNLGLEVIAEGVETEAQRSFLFEHGCHAYQGYFFGKPMPVLAFEQCVGESCVGAKEALREVSCRG